MRLVAAVLTFGDCASSVSVLGPRCLFLTSIGFYWQTCSQFPCCGPSLNCVRPEDPETREQKRVRQILKHSDAFPGILWHSAFKGHELEWKQDTKSLWHVSRCNVESICSSIPLVFSIRHDSSMFVSNSLNLAQMNSYCPDASWISYFTTNWSVAQRGHLNLSTISDVFLYQISSVCSRLPRPMFCRYHKTPNPVTETLQRLLILNSAIQALLWLKGGI